MPVAIIVIGQYAGYDTGTAGLLPALWRDERVQGAARAMLCRSECRALQAHLLLRPVTARE